MEGTPLETSSCALCSEGLVPLGWDGLLEAFFLKLVAITIQARIELRRAQENISQFLRINR